MEVNHEDDCSRRSSLARGSPVRFGVEHAVPEPAALALLALGGLALLKRGRKA